MNPTPAAPPIRPIPVCERDVLPFRKRHCKACAGSGHITIVLRSPIPDAKGSHDVRKRKLCGCGIKAFQKKQATLVSASGQLFFAEPIKHATPETLAQYKPTEPETNE